MVDPSSLYKILTKNKIDFYVGVPDSLLKNFCSYIDYKVAENKNIIAANEGNAISIAAGYHLATKKIPLVYMQNSGLGNCINPLTSLTNKEVYQIPMILLIGWRGEPLYEDEPQHTMPGYILKNQLKLINIQYYIINKETNISTVIKRATTEIKKNRSPVALIVSKNTFSKNRLENKKMIFNSKISRYEAIKHIVSKFKKDLIISTTGKASRELHEIRKNNNELMNDFLTVGSMGHVSSIAMGIALGEEKRNVICIDGDGSLIMHMGNLAIIGSNKITNLKHFLINNGCHDSVGGQITAGSKINFSKIANASGYSYVKKCRTINQVNQAINECKKVRGSSFIEIQINVRNQKNLGRPDSSPIKNKENFMRYINKINK
tara:strand:+ start:61267 stop:62397 length:1131 start_codon:yes stop_codon:yes gene_type:complete